MIEIEKPNIETAEISEDGKFGRFVDKARGLPLHLSVHSHLPLHYKGLGEGAACNKAALCEKCVYAPLHGCISMNLTFLTSSWR